MVIHHFGEPLTRLYSIIYNGHSYQEAKFPESPFPGKKIVFTAANWRPHKRLNDTIKGFLAWDQPDTVLCIAGTDKVDLEAPNVFCLGFLNQQQLFPYYQHAIAFLHFCWIDCCPNTVVEALCSGTPVVCTSNGGTKELVRESGIIIDEEEYDLEPCHLYNPPEVPPHKVADALDKIYAHPIEVHRPDLDISRAALEYESLILKTIEEHRKKNCALIKKLSSSEKHPAISVIMSVYNAGQFLHEAIDSILNQTFKDFEFIIINDSSTDNSSDIISSFDDQRIKIINNDKNLGLAASLNIALQIARGKFIARLDADDICNKGRLKKQYNYLQENPQIKILGSACNIINESGIHLGEWSVPCSPDEVLVASLEYNPFVHSSVIFCRESAKSCGNYPEIPFSQDYALWIKMLKKYKGSNIAEPLIQYRQHRDQISQQNHIQNKRQKIKHLIQTLAASNPLARKLSPQHNKELLVKQVWAQWQRQHPNARLALYGTGKHSQFLKETLGKDFECSQIVSFLDDSPLSSSLWEIPVHTPESFNFREVDLIIVSSDTFHKEMVNKLSRHVERERILCFY